ncbi:acyltransferase family protein [Aureimonas sp. AU12]|uniref:acyltransferase family protein n=1 Tax=Aureimonas sp. AU12 TaxID=1638161 RepID=UPI000782EEDE|nr:acyltransferase family protein [Aureimonas sp. AU12]
MAARYHGLDAARATFMLLGIPYHAAIVYNPYRDWSVHSPETSPVLALLAGAINYFRMPAFFLIAGFFAALLLARSAAPGRWLEGRLLRLGLPLVTAALLLNPLQMLATGWTDTFYGLPNTAAADLAQFGPQWVRHLWFLPVLMLLCSLAALAWLVAAAGIERLAALYGRMLESRPQATLLASAAVCALGCLTAATLPTLLHSPMKYAGDLLDLRNTLFYLPFFALGGLLGARPASLGPFNRFQPFLLALALALMAVHALVWGVDTPAANAVRVACSAFGGLLMAQSILAGLEHSAGVERRWVRFLVDASLTIYLLHQPVISLLGTGLLWIHADPILEFAGITALTLAITLAAHALVMRSDALLFLLNGRLAPSKPTRTREPVPAIGPPRPAGE